MKRLFIHAAGLTLGVVLTLMVTHLTAQHPATPAPPDKCTCKNDAFLGLTAQEFMEGVARFGNTHQVSLPNRPYAGDTTRLDARSCWYSIDTLRKFICFIEDYAKQVNAHSATKINTGKLGIRFYYAVYGKGETPPGHGGYMDRHTLFMMPTYRVPGVGNLDFDPRHTWNEYEHSKFTNLVMYNVMNMPLTAMPMMLDGVSTRLSTDPADDPNVGKNQGQLCPPNCPTTTWEMLQYIDTKYKDVNYSN